MARCIPQPVSTSQHKVKTTQGCYGFDSKEDHVQRRAYREKEADLKDVSGPWFWCIPCPGVLVLSVLEEDHKVSKQILFYMRNILSLPAHPALPSSKQVEISITPAGSTAPGSGGSPPCRGGAGEPLPLESAKEAESTPESFTFRGNVVCMITEGHPGGCVSAVAAISRPTDKAACGQTALARTTACWDFLLFHPAATRSTVASVFLSLSATSSRHAAQHLSSSPG
ncbi:uncharacterized protein LOC141922163 [Strix aluco]|uniref:uncharacterized protein LOC141922163 n=1 Tax=Strix aluco TaxID=111821 RepID=UPI003DA4FE1B